MDTNFTDKVMEIYRSLGSGRGWTRTQVWEHFDSLGGENSKFWGDADAAWDTLLDMDGVRMDSQHHYLYRTDAAQQRSAGL